MAARVLTLFLAVMTVAGAEAAFEGKVISSEEVPDDGPRAPGDVDLRFEVERIFKGSLGEQVTVRTSGDGGTCGLGPRERGERLALTLSRDEEGRWQGSICGTFDPDDLSDPGVPPPPSLEPATLAQLTRPSQISAWRDIAVWSAYDEAAGAYRLMAADGDAVGPLPVDPSPLPFDAVVGPDSSGDPAVVYSRCATVPEPPADRTTADCDLSILGLRDDRGERPIRNANSAGSESNPTLWRGEVAWARTYAGRPDEPFVYTRPLVAPRDLRSERAPGVPRDGAGNLRVQELELYGSNLAVDSRYTVEGGAGIFVDELRLADVRDRSSRRVARVDGGLSGRDYVGLSMDAGRLGWYLTCEGDPAGCAANGGPFRHRISTGDYERLQDATELAGFGWTLGGSYRVTAQEPAVTRTGPLDWRPVDADRVR